MRLATARLLAAAALVGGWLVLLFAGVALGGAVHLIALAALLVFPWRAARAESARQETAEEETR